MSHLKVTQLASRTCFPVFPDHCYRSTLDWFTLCFKTLVTSLCNFPWSIIAYTGTGRAASPSVSNLCLCCPSACTPILCFCLALIPFAFQSDFLVWSSKLCSILWGTVHALSILWNRRSFCDIQNCATWVQISTILAGKSGGKEEVPPSLLLHMQIIMPYARLWEPGNG